MRVKASGIWFGFLLCLFLFVFLAGSAFSDTVNYVYDNLGRHVMTTSSNGIKIMYGYDTAGHIISVIRTTGNQQRPVLTAISPRNVFVGKEVLITLGGSNLLSTKTVTTDNPGVQIISFSTADTSVNIDAEIQNTAATGPATFTVTTPSGSASISFHLLNLTFTPSKLVLLPGTSQDITVYLAGLTSDYNLVLLNKNPEIISAPQSLTVPTTGDATFTVNALSQGNGAIAAGNCGISVFVSEPFTGAGTASSKPVSVGNILNNEMIMSSPISVQPGFVWGSASSPLVSVKISQ